MDRLYNSLQALLRCSYASQIIRVCLAHQLPPCGSRSHPQQVWVQQGLHVLQHRVYKDCIQQRGQGALLCDPALHRKSWGEG